MPDWSDLLDWADQWWDEERGLLRNPPGSFDDHGMAPLLVPPLVGPVEQVRPVGHQTT